MSVSDSWSRIAAWYDEHTFPGKFTLNSGASPEAVDQLEQTLGSSLPSDFRESLLLHDAGKFCWLLWYGELLNTDAIARQWTTYRDWQDRGEYAIDGSADWMPHAIEGPIKPVFWSTKRVPITDNSGNHLILDLDPPVEGIYGQVVDHSHEVGPRTVLAPSWEEFLAQIAMDLDVGKYVYDEEEETVGLPGMWD